VVFETATSSQYDFMMFMADPTKNMEVGIGAVKPC
jgi:hypothetical protein